MSAREYVNSILSYIESYASGEDEFYQATSEVLNLYTSTRERNG